MKHFDNNKKQKKPYEFWYAIIIMGLSFVIVSGVILSCNSNKYEKISPPYRKDQLEKWGLSKLTFENNILTRVIYPPIARDDRYKSVLNRYIITNKEIQAFLSLGGVAVNSDDPKELLKLGIYMYEYAVTNSFISIAIEAEFKSPGEQSFSTWYAFNYDIQSLTSMDYNTIFEKPDEALKSIIQFLKEDIIRQKSLRKINIDADSFLTLEDGLLISLMNAFVLVPSVQQKNKFIGLRIFLNRFGDEEDSTYATQIPGYVFNGYLTKKMKKLFVDEPVPLVTESLYNQRSSTFPDITPFFE